MSLFCRVSRPYDEVKDVIALLTAKCDAIVVYEHVADADVSRTHIHFYVENPKITVEGIKKMFRKVVVELGRSDWAFNTKDVDRNCITYMSKGDLEPIYNRGGIQTDYYKELWEDRPKKQQAKLQFVVKETASEAKKRKNDLIEEMIVLVKDPNENVTYEDNDEKVVRCIIKVLNDNKIVFSRYTIRDYYDTLSARTNPSQFMKTMLSFIQYKN